MTTRVRIGLLRLVDSAPVLVAQERGLLADWGKGSCAGSAHSPSRRASRSSMRFRRTICCCASGWRGSGSDLDRDLRIISVPPEMSVQAIGQGVVAGLCAGAPWGGVAEESGTGRIALGSSAIWPLHPEKCLAVRLPWAEANPGALCRLLRALLRAGRLCDAPGEARAVADLRNRDPMRLSRTASAAALPGGAGKRISFHSNRAWMPRQAHERWYVEQMRRWGWWERSWRRCSIAGTCLSQRRLHRGWREGRHRKPAKLLGWMPK